MSHARLALIERSTGFRMAAAFVAAVALAAVVLQYVLLLQNAPASESFALSTLRFFAFFTILSNLAVVATCTVAAIASNHRSAWASPAVRGAVALYIGVTGAMYVLVLRHAWQPQGLQFWVDAGLHYATPVLFLAWWLRYVPHRRVQWGQLPWWWVFPLAYLAAVWLRGAWLGEYPYPFIDVARLGWAGALRNAGGMVLVFVVGSGVLRLLDGMLPSRGRRV